MPGTDDRVIIISGSSSTQNDITLTSGASEDDGVVFEDAMIRCYSLSNTPEDAIFLYKSMLAEGVESPNSFTYPFLVKSCARLSCLIPGRQVHCHVIRNRFESDIFIMNAMLHLYCAFRDMENACNVFEHSLVRDCVSYNTVISGYVQVGSY